jgi:hypothetical protein
MRLETLETETEVSDFACCIPNATGLQNDHYHMLCHVANMPPNVVTQNISVVSPLFFNSENL